MFQISNPIWLLACVVAAQASAIAAETQATITLAPRATMVNFGVVPTATGQVGVNPVEEDLGDPDIYRGTIQRVEKTFLTVEASTTRWLLGHTEYLTETTIKGSKTTVQLSVATAAAGAGTVAAGDITVIYAEGLANTVAKAANEAVKACNAVKVKRNVPRLENRDADGILNCLFEKGAAAYKDGGPFSIVNPAEWEAVVIEVSGNAVPIVKTAFQLAKTQSRKAMLALFMSAVAINISEAEAVGGVILVGAIVLPKLGFGNPNANDNDSGKCTSGAKPNSESPNCRDKDCVGTEDTEKCTVDPNKGCPCLVFLEVHGQPSDDKFLDQQLDMLHSIESMSRPTPSKNAKPITVNAPTPSPTCSSDGTSSPSVKFDIKIAEGESGISVNLPVADNNGDWTVEFEKSDSISYWEIHSGAEKLDPVISGNGAPSNGKIEWKFSGTQAGVDSALNLKFSKGNLNLKATISGKQSCKAPDEPSTGSGPNSSQCLKDCSALVPLLQQNYGDTVDVTNDNDLSKMVDHSDTDHNPLTNDWWRVASSGGCFLVIGKDAIHSGFSDFPPPVKRQDLIDFIEHRKDYACVNANPMLVVSPPVNISPRAGYGQFCLTDFANYQKCTGQVKPPS